jgi:hypothetical protein
MTDEKSSAPKSRAPFRRKGLNAAAESGHARAADVFAAHGFDNPQLVLRWREFAGPTLGRLTAPISLSPQGVLTISADPSVSVFLQHQTPLIAQKINLAFGGTLVAKVKVTAGAFRKPHADAPAPAPLPPEDQARLAAQVAPIQDQDLRAALARLGRAVLQAARTPARKGPRPLG